MTDSAYILRRPAGQAPWKAGGRPRLAQLDIELTERCNNDCIHCCINRPASDAGARARELPTGQIQDLLHQAAGLGSLSVRFTGGEPLLRSDFQELYRYARQLGLKVMVFTNACLVTAQMADLFAAVPPLAPIEVSAYGMHPESYEAVTRTPGSFAQFRRGVGLLQQRGVPFIVKSVLLPQLMPEIAEFEAWAATLPEMRQPPNYTVFLDLRGRRDDARKNALIAALRPAPQKALAVLARSPESYRRNMAGFAARFMGPPGDRLFECGALHGLCIDAYGRAQPCIGLRAPEVTLDLAALPQLASADGKGPADNTQAGRAGELKLNDALEHFRRLGDMRSTNPDYLLRCARCFLKGLCEQCPAKSWGEHGTLDTPVTHLCEAAHMQARYLGWLKQSETGWEVKDWQERIRPERLPPAGKAAGYAPGA